MKNAKKKNMLPDFDYSIGRFRIGKPLLFSAFFAALCATPMHAFAEQLENDLYSTKSINQEKMLMVLYWTKMVNH